VDTRDTTEQAELRRAARHAADRLGPDSVRALDDDARRDRLRSTVDAAGWLELRDDAGDGRPLASGVEAAIVADALGGAAADVAFAGPLLARDLARRAGITIEPGAVVAFDADLLEPGAGVAVDTTPGVESAYGLVDAADGRRLVRVDLSTATTGSDLTRSIAPVVAGSGRPVGRPLTDADLTGWRALGLALTSADLVGVMRGVLGLTVAYASDRRQFGVPVGSFQAVQHLLAEAHCLMEGAHSVTLHASWAVDELAPRDALAAARVAKAYAARAARAVCETAVQVHGGIGNTWDCTVHVYLRRALLSSRWLGDDAVQLRALADERTGGGDGLP
jgi:alkylation response protein AidB-like acyl-CoA dehydrogenase